MASPYVYMVSCRRRVFDNPVLNLSNHLQISTYFVRKAAVLFAFFRKGNGGL